MTRNIHRFTLQFLVIAALFTSGHLLECYKCPVEMKDMLYCSDPFENMNYQEHCDSSKNVCLKMSVQGSGNHVEERGCAKSSAVTDICNSVRKNFKDVTCEVCDTDLCNVSTRRTVTTPLLSIYLLTWKLLSAT